MYVDVFCHFDAARLISAMDKQMDGCSDKHRAAACAALYACASRGKNHALHRLKLE